MANKNTPIIETEWTEPESVVETEWSEPSIEPLKKKESTQPQGEGIIQYTSKLAKENQAADYGIFGKPVTVTSEEKPKSKPVVKEDIGTSIKKAEAEQFKTWKDTPEGVNQEIKNNYFNASNKAYEIKKETVLNNSLKQFQENPLFSKDNPNAEKNKQAYIQTLANKGYDKEEMSNALGVEYKPTSAENLLNQLDNTITIAKKVIPQTKLAFADLSLATLPKTIQEDGSFGLDKKGVVGVLVDWQKESLSNLKNLDSDIKPSLGIIETAKAGDIAGVISATAGVVMNLAGTTATSAASLGTGIVGSSVGSALYEYNSEKAKRQGVTIEELYAKGENETLAPSVVGTAVAGLEMVGLKGIGNYVTSKIAKEGTEELAKLLMSATKEGTTEWVQTGLETYNTALAQGKSHLEATKESWDVMTSEQGYESLLAGVVGAGAVGGGSKLLKQKAEIQAEIKKAEESSDIQSVNLFKQKEAEIDEQLNNEISIATQNESQKALDEVDANDKKETLQSLELKLTDETLTETGKEAITNNINAIKEVLTKNELRSELLIKITSPNATVKDIEAFQQEASDKGVNTPELDDIAIKRIQELIQLESEKAATKNVDIEITTELPQAPEVNPADINETETDENVEPIITNVEQSSQASKLGGIVKFARKVSAPFKYRLIEANELQPSHLASGERNPAHTIALAQIKERNDTGSKEAQDSIANTPNFSELGEMSNAYFGAPTITPKGEVIQGNNRSIGLKKHYEHEGVSYKEQLYNEAEKYGFTKEQVAGMKSPILVREIPVDDNIAIELGNYDVKDLETGGKERVSAIATVRKMSPKDKSKLSSIVFDGDYKSIKDAIRSNSKKVKEIIGVYVNSAQRNTIFDTDGNITSKGMDDIESVAQNLIFDNGSATLPEVFDSFSSTVQKNIQKATKNIFSVSDENSLLPELQKAMLALYEFNQSGLSDIESWANQFDLFNGVMPSEVFTPIELSMAKILSKAKKQDELSVELGEYEKLINGKDADMFSEGTKGISKGEAINKQFNVKYNETGNAKTEGSEGSTTNTQRTGGTKEFKTRPKDKGEVTVPDFEDKLTDKTTEFLSKLKDSKATSPKTKEAITENGINRKSMSFDVAKEVGDSIFNQIKGDGSKGWIDKALAWSSIKHQGVPMQVNSFVLGNIIADLNIQIKSAKTKTEKESLADITADIAKQIDDMLVDAGGFVGAFSEVYKLSELGIIAKNTKAIQRAADAILDEKKGDATYREKIKEAWEEFEKLKNSTIQDEVNKRVDELYKKTATKAQRAKIDPLIKKLEDLQSKLRASAKSDVTGLVGLIDLSFTVTIGTLKAGKNVSRAIKEGVKFLEQKMKEAGYDKDTITKESLKQKKLLQEQLGEEVEDEASMPSNNVSKARSIGDSITASINKALNPKPKKEKVEKTQEEKDLDKYLKEQYEASMPSNYVSKEEQQKKILNKMFPKKRLSSSKKRARNIERIIKAYQEGVTSYEQFESAFSDLLGIVDAKDPSVKEMLEKTSKQEFNASSEKLKQLAQTNLETFLEEKRKTKIADYVTTPFYFNILSGYNTHLRNLDFNIFSSFGQAMLLAQKNPKSAKFILKAYGNSMKEALKMANYTYRTGDVYGEKSTFRTLAERKSQDNKLSLARVYRVPFRLLRTADVLGNTAILRMKEHDLLLERYKAENKRLPESMQVSRKQMEYDINDTLYNTQERLDKAKEQATKDIEAFLGEEFDPTTKKVQSLIDARMYEIMEDSRSNAIYEKNRINKKDVLEESKTFANQALLQGEVQGSLGRFAKTLETLAKDFPVSKFIMTTFIRVPLNSVNHLIDRTPYAFLRIASYKIKGRRGMFVSELTPAESKATGIVDVMTKDQEKEALIRAVNYTTMLVGFTLLTQLKYDDEEEGERPILIATADGTGDYTKNETLGWGTGKKDGSKYKEYTADFMGYKFDYRYNPLLSPFLLPIGAATDYKKYKAKTQEEKESLVATVQVSTAAYLKWAAQASTLENLTGQLALFDAITSMEGNSGDKIEKKLYEFSSKMIVPNLLSQATKDIDAIMEKARKKPIEASEYFYKDIPFVRNILENKLDHLGREVKSEFNMPIILVPNKLNVRSDDPYYKSFIEHNYYPTNSKEDVFFDGKGEITLEPKELYQINKDRGDFVLKALSSNNLIEGKTLFQRLNEMGEEDYKKEMNKLFGLGEDYARNKMVGYDINLLKDLKMQNKEFTPKELDIINSKALINEYLSIYK